MEHARANDFTCRGTPPTPPGQPQTPARLHGQLDAPASPSCRQGHGQSPSASAPTSLSATAGRDSEADGRSLRPTSPRPPRRGASRRRTPPRRRCRCRCRHRQRALVPWLTASMSRFGSFTLVRAAGLLVSGLRLRVGLSELRPHALIVSDTNRLRERTPSLARSPRVGVSSRCAGLLGCDQAVTHHGHVAGRIST